MPHLQESHVRPTEPLPACALARAQARALRDPRRAVGHTVASLPFVQRYGAADLAALRELATLFIAEKEYSTARTTCLLPMKW
ncbi:hypothetical protein ACU4GD_33550 [Cupriavidus basilensis]